MKLRRVYDDGRVELQTLGADGSWAATDDSSALGWVDIPQ